MNEFQDVAASLRRMADDLGGVEKRLKIPVQSVDVRGAIAKVRAVLGDGIHIAVRGPDFDSYSSGDFKVGPWGVYLGTEAPNGAHGTHEGITLADAVNAALKACEEHAPGNAVEQAAAIAGEFAEPLPL